MKFSPSREEIILKYARGKEVLDCGCVEKLERDENWLHGKLVKVAKKVVGVDLWKEGVQKLREEGYCVLWGDVTTINLKRRFDVIVAGELIEHLPNPGKFLENMAKHLKREGVLILTTPNAWAFPYQWTEILRWNRRWASVSRQWGLGPHVGYHTPDTLWALAETHGFQLAELWGCPGNPPKRGMRKIVTPFRNLLCSVFPQLSSTLVAVLRPRRTPSWKSPRRVRP